MPDKQISRKTFIKIRSLLLFLIHSSQFFERIETENEYRFIRREARISARSMTHPRLN